MPLVSALFNTLPLMLPGIGASVNVGVAVEVGVEVGVGVRVLVGMLVGVGLNGMLHGATCKDWVGERVDWLCSFTAETR